MVILFLSVLVLFHKEVAMLSSKSVAGRILSSALLALAVVALASLSNPLFAGYTYSICWLAANPCQACGNGSNYQCLPTLGYQWGACSGQQQTKCFYAGFKCQDSEEWTCAVPPNDLGHCTIGSTAALASCQYGP
jgi:hypothetical protein